MPLLTKVDNVITTIGFSFDEVEGEVEAEGVG
jgi:hypothetical protein